MHKEMYRAYREMIPVITGSVLEVGATPDTKSLLCLPQLKGAERKGLNLDGPHSFDGFTIDKGDANAMPYADNSFDCVICNAVLEHVPRPLNVVDEIKRVTKPGGLIVIGVPGYRPIPALERWQGRLSRMLPMLASGPRLNAIVRATPVFQVHNEPGDYWRASLQCVREVFMEGLADVKVTSVMLPPRLIGVGVKVAANS